MAGSSIFIATPKIVAGKPPVLSKSTHHHALVVWRFDSFEFAFESLGKAHRAQHDAPSVAICCSSASTRGQTGSIVLKFRSVAECNDFFDELLDLNGRKPGSSTDGGDDKNNRCSAALHNLDHNDIQRRRQDTLLYLARLLHDDDFQDFVKNVEDSLTSTEDGAKMLAPFQVGGKTESIV